MEQYSVLSSCWLPWYERTDERHEKFDFSVKIAIFNENCKFPMKIVIFNETCDFHGKCQFSMKLAIFL